MKKELYSIQIIPQVNIYLSERDLNTNGRLVNTPFMLKLKSMCNYLHCFMNYNVSFFKDLVRILTLKSIIY